jgi:hypothetical protein
MPSVLGTSQNKNMLSHVFHAKFSNLPLDQREKFFTEGEYKGLTPLYIYFEIEDIENNIRRQQIRLEKLLAFSETFL